MHMCFQSLIAMCHFSNGGMQIYIICILRQIRFGDGRNVKPGGEGVRPTTWLAIYSPHSLVCSATYEDGEAVLSAALGVVTTLLHPDHGHRLLLDVVERVGLELDFLEVDVHEVDATDVAVPCCPVVQPHGFQVCSRSELSRAWQAFRDICLHVLAADRDVEVVQDVEGLDDCVEAVVPCWGCGLEEGSTDKSRWGCEVSRETEHAASVAQRLEGDARSDGVVGCRAWLQVDVVIEVGHVPLEAWGVCDDPKFVLVELRHTVDDFEDYHPAVRFGDSPVHGSDPVVECDQVEVVEGILHLVDC